MIPFAGAGRTGRVHGANAGIEQRFHRGIGMGGAAGIVGIVDHAGHAGIDAAHGGEIIADIVILRPIDFGERQMRGVHIIRKRRRIRIDAAQLPFPGMPMAIDQARHDDGVEGVDHLRIRGLDLGRDRRNFRAFDQKIAFHQVADLGVHADDGAAFEENAALRIDCLLAVEAANIVCSAVPESPSPAAVPAASAAPALSALRRDMRMSFVMVDPPLAFVRAAITPPRSPANTR